LQRPPSVPDTEAKTGRLVDVTILIRRAVEQVVEKPLSGLPSVIILVERRVRSKRDERNLAG
jgi:hypothetical protein